MSELKITILPELMKTEANIIIKKFKQKALKFLLKALKVKILRIFNKMIKKIN